LHLNPIPWLQDTYKVLAFAERQDNIGCGWLSTAQNFLPESKGSAFVLYKMIVCISCFKNKVLENTMRSSYRKMKLGKLIFWWAFMLMKRDLSEIGGLMRTVSCIQTT
jgi:hypothetical protein